MTWLGMLLGTQRRSPRLQPLVEEARAAVDGGLDVLVAAQHLRSEPFETLQPWQTLAAVRQGLEREASTVSCVIAGLTTVQMLAAEIDTLRAIGGGPVGVALAAGYRREDFDAAGRDFSARFDVRARMLEELERDGVGDVRWGCASTGTAAARAVAAGVRWYVDATVSRERVADMRLRAGGSLVLRRDVLLADSEADMRRRWASYVEPKYGAYGSWGFGSDSSAVIAGDAGTVAQALAELRESLAPEGFVLRLCWPDMDGETALRHIRSFTSEVVPQLRDRR